MPGTLPGLVRLPPDAATDCAAASHAAALDLLNLTRRASIDPLYHQAKTFLCCSLNNTAQTLWAVWTAAGALTFVFAVLCTARLIRWVAGRQRGWAAGWLGLGGAVHSSHHWVVVWLRGWLAGCAWMWGTMWPAGGWTGGLAGSGQLGATGLCSGREGHADTARCCCPCGAQSHLLDTQAPEAASCS